MGKVPGNFTKAGRVEKTAAAAPVRVGRWWKAAAVATTTALAAALAMAAPAAPASAQGSSDPLITIVHGSSDTNANQWKGVDLRCGGYFLGGGGYATGSGSQNVGVSQIAPGSRGGALLDDPHAMRVSATAAPESAPASWTLHAYGICAFGVSGVEYRRDYVSAYQEGRGPLSASARCSPGKSLVGMGAQAFAIPEQVRLSTLAAGNNVVTAAVTPQPDPYASWAVQAIAVCADHERAQMAGDSTDLDARNIKGGWAECPAGQHPTSAGFGHAGEAGNLTQRVLMPTSDRVLGITRTDTRTTTGSWLASIYALCLPARSI